MVLFKEAIKNSVSPDELELDMRHISWEKEPCGSLFFYFD